MQPLQPVKYVVLRPNRILLLAFCFTLLAITVVDGLAVKGNIGVLVPLRWNGAAGPMEPWTVRYAASAAMALHHINNRVASLVPQAAELLPANFTLAMDLKDSMAQPSVAVKHAVAWNEEEMHAIVGSYRSAVTGPLALVASIAATPVISWASTASTLSDRATYPTLSRTIVSDAVLAESTIRAIGAMGWTRIAILYVDDAWGRGWLQDVVVSARQFGMDVVVSAEFQLGDRSTIANAVSQVAESGARVTMTLAFEKDQAVIAAEAEIRGLLGTGYTWIIAASSLLNVVAQSEDPQKTLQHVTGWLEMAIDPSVGERGSQFQRVLESAPLSVLNITALQGTLTDAVRKDFCDMYCLTMYDAVWTAAIAMSSMEVADDGSVDKEALLAAIRNTSFEGASGWVQFDEIGERESRYQQLWIKNSQQVTAADGSVSLSMVPVWRWKAGVLERAGNSTPVWPGGEQGWELPYVELECESGSVFSMASLQCEPCPKGTAEEDGGCVRFDASVGVLVPLRWGSSADPLEPWALRDAMSAAMAVHHINNRVASLVPQAAELLPANFKLVMDLKDSMAQPSVAVDHVVAWNEEGRHAIVGSYRSAVTGPMALAASIAATPVISWGATASSLSDAVTYPTLSRTAISDGELAQKTIRAIGAMGWTRIAIVYVDDAWGRSFAQDASSAANDFGIRVEVSVDYALGDQGSMENAIRQIAESGARVTLCLAFGVDIPPIAAIADSRGLLKRGYAWIAPAEQLTAEVVSSSPETVTHLTGFLTTAIDAYYGEAGQRFQSALENEPLTHLRVDGINASDSQLMAIIEREPCNQFCSWIYDAVWTAAIAMSSMEVADDGSVDKEALLAAIRNTSFEGASGRVQFEKENGERVANDQPLIFRNLRPVTAADGSVSLSMEPVWRWQGSAFERESSTLPVWPGGEQGWELPYDVLSCDSGSVFSTASLQCEPCPAGTAEEDGECVRYDANVGVLVPLRWNGADGPMEPWAIRKAASATLAVYHINNRVASLVPKAAELLPANFKLVMDLKDSMAQPSVAVKHAVAFAEEGRHAIVGSYRSAVTGPLALAASISATPVISWASTASTLSDRATYPTLSRTILSDAVLAESTIRAIGAMGWTRIAIVYVDDAWGRGYASDASAAAVALGMEVVASAKHSLGDRSGIAKAVSLVAASGARVTLCASFQSDVAAIVEVADGFGLLNAGYAWLLGTEISIEAVLSAAADRARMMQMLAGWMEVPMDLLDGDRGPRFHEAMYSAPLQDLDDSAFEGMLTEELLRGEPCDGQCAALYDAVWTAAIAMSSMEVADDGSVDKEALLAAIRNTSFEGASGRVQFDEIGERDPRDQWVRLNNVQQVTAADGSVSLSMVPVWRWKAGVLERAGNSTPVWPGGEQGWELPYVELECESGSVFSTASLQCEPCPKGTAEEDGGCVRFDASVGVLVPLRWGSPADPLEPWAVRDAMSAAMAVHHINNRVASLVPQAAELLPANFKLVMDLKDSMAQPSVAVDHVVAWNEEGRHAIVGSYRSAVTGPLALAASIAATPVISWGATASSLSDAVTYPTLSRTAISDSELAQKTIRAIGVMGWTRIAIVYVDDAWGRSFAQDASSAANDFGIRVEVSVDYALGDQGSMENAIRQIAESGARVTLCLAFGVDIPPIAAIADSRGLLKRGYAWIAPAEQLTAEVVSSSPETVTHLTGFLTTAIDAYYGEAGQRFQSALETEPLTHLRVDGINASDSQLMAIIEREPCNQFCSWIYDAVWTAAIAMSSMEVADDGSVDKEALLAAIRNTSFEGASGRVQFEKENGERVANDQPLIFRNLRPVTAADGSVSLSMEPVWRWQGSAFERESSTLPVWPGGEQGWELPYDVLSCDSGSVFSTASLQCEPCPAGTTEEDGECVRSDANVGVLVPLRWNGADGPMEPWAIRKAASATLAVYHINNRVASLVPKAAELLPANFKLVMDLKDTMAQPSVAVKHAVAFAEEGRHAIVGSYRSAVTGPLALAASISATPVISWASTASTLSDRATYPTLSRTILSDAVLAESTIRAIGAMGWTRIAIVYVDDAWGRGYASDASAAAVALGMEVVASAKHSLGDRSGIAKAVSLVAASGARVTLCASFQSDVAAIVEVADGFGLLNAGYAWLLGTEISIEAVLSAAADRARMMQMLAGWMEVPMDLLDGDRGPRFHEAMYSAPLQDLDDSAFEGMLTEELLRGEPCDGQCAALYDAVWTAAIAMSSMEVADDGSVDKEALLAAIRNTSFEGASGRVQFDEIGERDPRDQWVRLNNVQQVTAADGSVSLSMVPVWRWKAGVLERAGNSTPVWPGGEQGWELPYVELECESGSVFSTASLQCEPCPKGTAEEDGGCVRFDASVGVLVPLRWGGSDSPMASFALRWGASATMALHHINNRVASLVPQAAELLPANFKLVMDLRDTMAQPSVAVKHAVAFNEEGRHAIVGSLRSAVTGPLALAASIAATPVISWASTASNLVDRQTYPTLGRTVLSDAMLAAATIQSVRAIGWKRVAIFYVSDSWGRSLVQDFVALASDVGVEIVTAADYAIGDLESIRDAASTIADSGARVILCATYDADLAFVAEAADAFGMVTAGYSWIVMSDMNFNDVVSLSSDPEKTHQRLTGWMTAAINPLFGGLGSRFQEVYQSEPLEHLNYGILDGYVSEAIVNGCDQYCAALYDAVWTAAIAISRMEVADDGSVDKEALLAAIREVSFEGATGRVQFEKNGERSPAGIPLLLQNLRPASRRSGELGLDVFLTWEWLTDGDGSGTLSRVGQEAPYWPGGERNWTAPPDGVYCPPGFVFSRASVECEACPPGTALLDGTCQDCPLGTFSSTSGAIACERCQIGYANATGMTACSSCPSETVRSAASPGINFTECLCVLGYYSQHGPGYACEPCVTGAQCQGGDQAPYPAEGFWADQECEQFRVGNKSCPEWDSFVPCNPADNCKGGPDFECSQGREGRLCLETKEDWSNVGGTFYWQCGENGKLITVAGIIGVLIVWTTLNAVAAGQYVALNIALMFVQVTAIIGSFGLKWHSYLHYVNIAMGVANFDVDFVSASCLVPWSPITSFYFQLSLPFVFGAAYIIYFCVAELWHVWHDKQPKVHYKRMLRQTLKYFISFVLTNYTTLAVKCFQSLRCTSFPDGNQYMHFASQVQCWTGSHWPMVAISVLYILGILVGLPVCIWFIIKSHKKAGTLHTIAAEWQWGFVHDAYEADYKWWECVLIFRRLSIAFIAVMIPEPMLQGASTLVLLVGLLSAQTFTAPFIRADIDVLDFLAICGSMFYCLSGMLFYPSVTASAQGHLCTENSDSTFCTWDQDVKQFISVMAFITILTMVLLSVGVTVRSVLERRASMLATKKIRRLQNLNRSESRTMANESVNRVLLDQILHGRQLLKWSCHLADRDQSAKYKASSIQFLEIESEIMALDVDMTPSSSHMKAVVMRHLCELPGFVDYLTNSEDEGVAATYQFVDNVAWFLEDHELNGRAFISTALTRFEHRPLLCYWLASAGEMKRRLFRLLVQAIHRANGHDVGDLSDAGAGSSLPRRSVDGCVDGWPPNRQWSSTRNMVDSELVQVGLAETRGQIRATAREELLLPAASDPKEERIPVRTGGLVGYSDDRHGLGVGLDEVQGEAEAGMDQQRSTQGEDQSPGVFHLQLSGYRNLEDGLHLSNSPVAIAKPLSRDPSADLGVPEVSVSPPVSGPRPPGHVVLQLPQMLPKSSLPDSTFGMA